MGTTDREPLTDTLAKATTYDGRSKCIVWDSLVKGFGLRIYPSGEKSWVVKYRVRRPGARPRLDVIAPLELMKAEAARRKAMRMSLDAYEGTDPRTGVEDAKTVEELFKSYMELYVHRECAPVTQQEVERMWRQHLLPRFGDLPLLELTPDKLLHMKLEMEATPAAFNHAMTYLHTALEKADQWRWIDRGIDPNWKNPASIHAVDRFPKGEIRKLTHEEIRLFDAALDAAMADEPTVSHYAIAVMRYTGARTGEVLSARCEWVELRGGHAWIHRPVAKGYRRRSRGSKKGRDIACGPRAAALVRDALAWPSEWLFPSPVKPSAPLRSVRKTFAGLLEAAGIREDATGRLPSPGALRHAFRDQAERAGLQEAVTRDLMDHRTYRMSEHYRSQQRDLMVEGIVAVEATIAGDEGTVH